MEPRAIQYQTWERAFLPTTNPPDPFRESVLRVEITNPYGDVRWREGFWDGGVWRLRWMPLEQGPHHLRFETTLPGLPASLGLVVEAAAPPEPGFRHGLSTSGPVRVADEPTHFARHDGTPFFLACEEVHSVPLRATDAEWAFYCAQRSRIGLTGVGFATDLRRFFAPSEERGEEAPPTFTPDLAYLADLDRRIATLNAHGLVALPDLFRMTTIDHPLNVHPGADLDDVVTPLDAVRLGRYLDARWGAYDVLWRMNLPGGAEDDEALVALTAEIGRSVFGVDPWRAPVAVDLDERETLHPLLRDEAWIGWIASRTHGHWNEASLSWIRSEYVAASAGPPRPHVNVDPIVYGDQWQVGDLQGARSARELVYASVFAVPPAGAGFTMRQVHEWARSRLDPENSSEAISWLQAIEDPGAAEIGRIPIVLSKYRWSDLAPAPELLVQEADSVTGAGVLANSDRSMIRVYVPRGETIRLVGHSGRYTAYWVSPRLGEVDVALPETSLSEAFTPPDERDWVLELDEAERPF